MGKFIGFLVVLALIIGVINWGIGHLEDAQQQGMQEAANADKRIGGMAGAVAVANDVGDTLAGGPQVRSLARAKVGATQADLMTYKTAITMFYTQRDRYPNSLQELVDTNMLSPSALKDPWGQPFRSEIKNGKMVLYSSGQGKIAHTSDDVWAEIPLQ